MPGREVHSAVITGEEAPGRILDEADLLPLSRLADLEFCERRAALHLVEMAWEDNVHTTEGSVMHERVHGDDSPEKRGDLVIVRGLWLRSLRLGLSGKADIVELHRTGDVDVMGASIPGYSGRWLVTPVEYKPGRLKHQRSFQVQLCAQALCLEEMMNCSISVGAIFYGKNRRRLKVQFDKELRFETKKAAARLHELVASGITPPAEYSKRCESCSLIHICMPKTVSGKHPVSSYLESLGE